MVISSVRHVRSPRARSRISESESRNISFVDECRETRDSIAPLGFFFDSSSVFGPFSASHELEGSGRRGGVVIGMGGRTAGHVRRIGGEPVAFGSSLGAQRRSQLQVVLDDRALVTETVRCRVGAAALRCGVDPVARTQSRARSPRHGAVEQAERAHVDEPKRYALVAVHVAGRARGRESVRVEAADGFPVQTRGAAPTAETHFTSIRLGGTPAM
jgi:hypothetical protein